MNAGCDGCGTVQPLAAMHYWRGLMLSATRRAEDRYLCDRCHQLQLQYSSKPAKRLRLRR